ncbi:MAG: ribose 5-phosphate isomerase B [Deltaproteobacteria bacterium]|nr:ribose 5-phosphate isomerase B [Deltaproteobacteria bacterium]
MIENKSPIVIGADHAAYDLKETVKAFLVEMGIDVHDVGTHGKDSVDYPDVGIMAASMVSKGKLKRGILLCGTGIGMSMVANKFPYVRAALCNDIFSAVMSRRHNDANILVLGGRIIGDILALEIVRTWIETPFEGGRHQTRIDKIDGIDQKGLIANDSDG